MKWTEEEKDYLKANYYGTFNSELAKTLNRAPGTISKYATTTLGLSKDPSLMKQQQIKAAENASKKWAEMAGKKSKEVGGITRQPIKCGTIITHRMI